MKNVQWSLVRIFKILVKILRINFGENFKQNFYKYLSHLIFETQLFKLFLITTFLSGFLWQIFNFF